jgi:hypothetical protein
MKPVVSSLVLLSALVAVGVPTDANIDILTRSDADKAGAAVDLVDDWNLPKLATTSNNPRGERVMPFADQGDGTRSWVTGVWPLQTKRYQLALAAPAARPAAAQGTKHPSIANPADIVIDVIVAYTKRAADHYPDIKLELIDPAIEGANASFRLSNLGHIRLRLVHAYQTGYAEEGTHFDHVWRFADKGDGYMEEIHSLRDEHRADVAVLIVDDPKGCGLATRVEADADEAFSVVHHECAATNYTLAHEIGHLIGARHDLSYVNGTKWRDIMGYKESCGGCARVPVWSSPTVLIRGEPAGTPELDNARVIAEQAARVAAFR